MTDWSERALKRLQENTSKQCWGDLYQAVQTHVQDFNTKAGTAVFEVDNKVEDELYVKGPMVSVVVTLTGEPAIQYGYLRGAAGETVHSEGGKYTFALEHNEECLVNWSTGEKTSVGILAERILGELVE